jgi:hypothetical protein
MKGREEQSGAAILHLPQNGTQDGLPPVRETNSAGRAADSPLTAVNVKMLKAEGLGPPVAEDALREGVSLFNMRLFHRTGGSRSAHRQLVLEQAHI